MSSGLRPLPIEMSPGAPEYRSGWAVEPFREGSAADYTRLRALFERAQYTEPVLCERHGIADLGEFRQLRDGRGPPEPVEDACILLTRLFLDSETVALDTLRALLTEEELATLETLGLLHAPRGESDARCGTVLLYPTHGLWIASDVNADHDGGELPPPPDVVYPAISDGTQRFLELMPRERCEAFLDMCAGTAVAALVAAREFATHAWAVDLTARATRFARFNAALNGIENFTALEGDLWEPVRGLTFDRIVAHPPYMPAFETLYVFRDGGEDGEEVTRRIVGGLATYLRPGGSCFCSCMATDRHDAPLERRVREMLGERGPEFDLVVAQERSHEPMAFFAAQARGGRMDWAGVGRRQAAFDEMRIAQLVVCSMLFRHRGDGADEGEAMTLRCRRSPHTVAADLPWLLDRAGRRRVAALLEAPERLRPRTARGVVVRTEHRCTAEGWFADECEVVTAAPFTLRMHCPSWFTALLMRCDGTQTAPELLDGLRRDGMVPAQAPLAEFAALLLRLVDCAVLQVTEWPMAPRVWREQA